MTVETPTVKEKDFKNLDAALDFARFAEPQWLSIEQIANGVRMTYQGNKGEI